MKIKKVESWLKSYKSQNTKVLLQTNIEIFDGVLKLCWYLVPLLKKNNKSIHIILYILNLF